MLCRKPCIGRKSQKEYLRRCATGQVNSCSACRHLKEESSRFLSYGGDSAPTEFLRGTKNSMAAGGCRAVNFFCRPRRATSSTCFKSEAAISEERCTR